MIYKIQNTQISSNNKLSDSGQTKSRNLNMKISETNEKICSEINKKARII